MTDDERILVECLESSLRARGYVTTVSVSCEGEKRFFASSPTKIPIDVWQAAVDELEDRGAATRMREGAERIERGEVSE